MLKNYIPNSNLPEWLDLYNRATDGTEKKRCLDIGLKESPSPENTFRHSLWEKRFTKNGEITGYDFFLAQWIDLNYNLKRYKSFFRKLCYKSIAEIAENLMINSATDKAYQEILYQEYLNMVCEYIDLCEDDQNYRKTFLGLKTMSKDNLVFKIAYDVYSTGIGTAKLFNQEDSFSLLAQATSDAFHLAYPNGDREWEKAIHDFAKKYLS